MRPEFAETEDERNARLATKRRAFVPFVCPRCGAASYNPHDLAEGYCGRCHAFVVDEKEGDGAI